VITQSIGWRSGRGVELAEAQRATHTYIIGHPGVGKSRSIESAVMQDVAARRGLAVIDPHGELYDHLLLRISRLAATDPSVAERVVLFNPSDPVWTVGFNPLAPIPGVSMERLAWFLTDVIVKIWKIDASSAPRMVRLLTFTFLVLAECGLSLVELPRFLCDFSYRQLLVSRTKHQAAAEYFQFEFPTNPPSVHQWVTPVLNKIGPLIFDPDVRLMLSAGSIINMRRILDENRILLVNLSKGVLGEGNSNLLGAFIVAHLQQAALARANGNKRNLFFLYLDEFQNYTTDNIEDILSESRKYGLSLVLAHQYLDQLANDMRAAVLNTGGIIISFRVGYQDASVLAREIFPPGFLREMHQDLRFLRLGGFPLAYIQERNEAVGHDLAAALLTQLKSREFWIKQRGPRLPVKQRSLEMPDPPHDKDSLDARKMLLDSSGSLYGRRKSEVRKEIAYERPTITYTTTDFEEI
jgi:hypothetical protein